MDDVVVVESIQDEHVKRVLCHYNNIVHTRVLNAIRIQHKNNLHSRNTKRMTRNENVSWERFEEQTKLAFVGNSLNSRFFLKTRVISTKNVKVVARVSHYSVKSTTVLSSSVGERNEAVKYMTTDTTKLFRLMKLLHFVMQEVLGPMKSLGASTVVPALCPESKPVNTLVNQANNQKKLKKKKNATKSLT
ncbi:unnamed protein product [Peronospora belbahrii]|uniref:Uncharacterized protein n=1 Tax=Peronospora belbahrii TaxID=622444 RepID=A0AAU9L973_9STRA|nr:unnamed protein product [Peronospora belbahrii]CAH0522468.1 unnamed protein product [Peronospora belbahrii]